MKKTAFVALTIYSTLALASAPWEQFPGREEGIKIIPSTQKEEKYFFEIQNHGFIKEPNKNALSLMEEVSRASQEIKSFAKKDNPKGTHLRLKHEEVSFAFNFPEVRKEDAAVIYGFAPYIAYVDNQWTGGVELFKSNFGLSCRLKVNAAKLNHSSMFISEKSKTTKINDKITTQSVSGDDKYGYMYTVSWYDDTFFRELECASKQFDATVIDKLVDIAKRADT